MTILLANGCSHTSGWAIEPSVESSYQQAWPRWLADDMGWEWVNLAEPGNSNEQIRRTTVEWLIDNVEINCRYKSEDVVVMIMWSGINRFELWNTETQQLNSYNGAANISRASFELKEYVKYKTIIGNSDVDEYKNLMDIYLTVKYLESLNIKYYFMSALHAWSIPERYSKPSILVEKYKLLYEAYGDRRYRHLGFISSDETFWKYMKKSNIPFSIHDVDTVKTHYGVDGHKYWKECVKNWMNQIDNLTC